MIDKIDKVRIRRINRTNNGDKTRLGLYAVFNGEEAAIIREALESLHIENISEFARQAVVAELKRLLDKKAK